MLDKRTNQKDYTENELQMGIAPYLGEYNQLHTWIMLKSKKKTPEIVNGKLIPLLNFLKGTFLLEVGSKESHWDLHFMKKILIYEEKNMYKFIIITTLFISNNLYAMDKMHDHNSRQHDHDSHVAVDGAKTKLDDAMYNKFVSDLGSSQVVIVDVNGMVCDFCARGIEKTFYDDNLVKRVLVSLETGKVLIAYDNAKKVDFGEIKNIFLSNGQSATGMTLKKLHDREARIIKAWITNVAGVNINTYMLRLPALFVTLGAGATFASMVSAFPQLIIISHYKVYISIATLIILVIAGFFIEKSKHDPCPIDPNLRNICLRTRKRTSFIYYISVGILYLLVSLHMFFRSIYK